MAIRNLPFQPIQFYETEDCKCNEDTCTLLTDGQKINFQLKVTGEGSQIIDVITHPWLGMTGVFTNDGEVLRKVSGVSGEITTASMTVGEHYELRVNVLSIGNTGVIKVFFGTNEVYQLTQEGVFLIYGQCLGSTNLTFRGDAFSSIEIESPPILRELDKSWSLNIVGEDGFLTPLDGNPIYVGDNIIYRDIEFTNPQCKFKLAMAKEPQEWYNVFQNIEESITESYLLPSNCPSQLLFDSQNSNGEWTVEIIYQGNRIFFGTANLEPDGEYRLLVNLPAGLSASSLTIDIYIQADDTTISMDMDYRSQCVTPIYSNCIQVVDITEENECEYSTIEATSASCAYSFNFLEALDPFIFLYAIKGKVQTFEPNPTISRTRGQDGMPRIAYADIEREYTVAVDLASIETHEALTVNRTFDNFKVNGKNYIAANEDYAMAYEQDVASATFQVVKREAIKSKPC